MDHKFALRHKDGNLLVTEISSNEGADCCGETTTELCKGYGEIPQNIWLADSAEHAEWVKHNPTEWYNADYNTPQHSFKPHKLEVVTVEITVNVEPVEVSIPTPSEYFTWKYEEREKRHLEYLLSELKKGKDVRYSYYDLREYLEKKENERA